MVDTSKLKELAPGRPSDRANQHKGKRMGNVVCDEFDNSSAVTVYKNAVEPCSKRDSSSSEDMLDTSDEVDKLNIGNLTTSVGNDNVVRFITENQVRGRPGEDDVQLHCSREEVPTLSNRVPERCKAEQMIRRC